MSLLVNPLLGGVTAGLSYSDILADIGGTQLRWQMNEAGLSDLYADSHAADADYAFVQAPDNTAPGTYWQRTSGRPEWDTYGVIVSSLASGARNLFYGPAADAVTALMAMTSGFVACWIVPHPGSNSGTIFALSDDATNGQYARLWRVGTDQVVFSVSSGGANEYNISKTGLTFGSRMFVCVRKTAGNVWSLWINGADTGSSGAASGGVASDWFSTVTNADTLSLGTLRRNGYVDISDGDVVFDLAVGDTAPTDQQIADLYAAVLP